jgi:hypothetical protein
MINSIEEFGLIFRRSCSNKVSFSKIGIRADFKMSNFEIATLDLREKPGRTLVRFDRFFQELISK